MTDVFISYSHKDFEYAHRLADELKRHQIDVWIDDRIDYGDQWPRTIQENLTACRTFIVIMSTNAFNSMWVQNEVSYAQAANKTIFPLLLEGNVWLSMAAMQYVDVRTGQMPPGRFYEKVQNSLKKNTVPHTDELIKTSSELLGQEHHASKRKPASRLFLAGSVLVFLIMAGALYSILTPDPTVTPATEPSLSEKPTSVTPPDETGSSEPIGNILSTEGKVTLLQIHDAGTEYGPSSDLRDVEVVIKLDSEPDKSFGFQLRDNDNWNTNAEMLELLRDVFNREGRVIIDYISTEKNTGVIVRVMNLP